MSEMYTILISSRTHGTTTLRLRLHKHSQSTWLQISTGLLSFPAKSTQRTLQALSLLQESILLNSDNLWLWRTPTTKTLTSRIGTSLPGPATQPLTPKRPQFTPPKTALLSIRLSHRSLIRQDSLWLLTTWRREMLTRTLTTILT